MNLNQTLLKALMARRRAARLSSTGVVWYDGPNPNFADVHEDGTPNLIVVIWNRIDLSLTHWAEHKVYCLRSELLAVCQWMASGFDGLAWQTRSFPLGIRVWSQRHPSDDKAYWTLRTAKYQSVLERGKLALAAKDRTAMERWLGQPTAA